MHNQLFFVGHNNAYNLNTRDMVFWPSSKKRSRYSRVWCASFNIGCDWWRYHLMESFHTDILCRSCGKYRTLIFVVLLIWSKNSCSSHLNTSFVAWQFHFIFSQHKFECRSWFSFTYKHDLILALPLHPILLHVHFNASYCHTGE